MEGRLVFDPDRLRLEHPLRPYQIWQQEYAESSVESLQIGSREWIIADVILGWSESVEILVSNFLMSK
jgi:hypothetical protein